MMSLLLLAGRTVENMRYLWTSFSAKTLGNIFSNDEEKVIENTKAQRFKYLP